MLLLQLAAILAAARLVGRLAARLGQPQVVGEMAAGILLGPSFLGWIAPGLADRLFPADGLAGLAAASQVGLAIFLFLVGLELDVEAIRRRGSGVAAISFTGIALPFLLGVLLAAPFHARHAPPGVPLLHFALFLGTAMSITAFPVLARILAERRLTADPLGSGALACAAVDDATAWTLLAAVTFLVGAGEGALAPWAAAPLLVAYALVMAGPGRRALRRLEHAYRARGEVTDGLLAGILLVALGSAAVTEALGVHALFGAFLAGAVMPKDPGFVRAVERRVEGVVVVLLLPLFFALSGLRTRVGLLAGAGMGLDGALVLAAAIAGKFGGVTLAARAGGLPAREAAALGILMNARGLMELVVLNIGLELGILSPARFTLMVLMALATTVMTTPLLARLYPPARRRA